MRSIFNRLKACVTSEQALLAAATLLDDTAHAQEKSPDVHPLIFEFGDGQWRSRPETVKFPCRSEHRRAP